MEYFILIGGQKQGPYDILDIIKKIKSGVLTPETLVSDNQETGFRPAQTFDDLKSLFKQDKQTEEPKVTRFTLKEVLNEGIDLWTRRIIEHTIFAGAVLAVSFAVSTLLRGIQIIADYPAVVNYFVSVITVTLFGVFFFYVLVTKRNMEVDYKEFFNVAKTGVMRLLIFSVIFSTYALPFEFGLLFGLLALGILTVVSTFVIFTPLLIQDRDLPLKRAAYLSYRSVTAMGADGIGIVLTLVAINLAVAIVPALIAKELFVFGLFISMPLTASAIAYIYDRIFT